MNYSANNGIAYRYGTEKDIPRIKELIKAGDLDEQQLVAENVLVAEASGKIVGINRVKYHADGAAEIASAYVIPEYRGQGINEKLTRLLMEQADRTLYIITNPRNRDYVIKMGFRSMEKERSIPASIREKVEWCRVHYNVPDPGPSVLCYSPQGK
ncbi:MAG TPA: GNAT family N-acetyltransferase [Candidatus Kapabacteria bacterium]|nr:GNAT family N-acetyltransferase [Candidatus Kapabacteria bacterium]